MERSQPDEVDIAAGACRFRVLRLLRLSATAGRSILRSDGGPAARNRRDWPAAGCAVLLGGAGDRAGNVAAGVAAAARRHAPRPIRPAADLVRSRRPCTWSGRLPEQSGWRRPGVSGQQQRDDSVSEQRGRGAYPSGGGTSMNSPGRSANAWTSATSNAPGDVVKIPVSNP